MYRSPASASTNTGSRNGQSVQTNISKGTSLFRGRAFFVGIRLFQRIRAQAVDFADDRNLTLIEQQILVVLEVGGTAVLGNEAGSLGGGGQLGHL